MPSPWREFPLPWGLGQASMKAHIPLDYICLCFLPVSLGLYWEKASCSFPSKVKVGKWAYKI